MDKVLIDSDVILDSFFNREPFVEFSRKILSLCELGKIKGYLTPLTYSNLYYLLKRVSKHEKVINNLKRLFQITEILPMGKKNVELALVSNLKDFEDALQNYAATNYGEINFILTRNLKDYKKSNLGIFTPETYLKSIYK